MRFRSKQSSADCLYGVETILRSVPGQPLAPFKARSLYVIEAVSGVIPAIANQGLKSATCVFQGEMNLNGEQIRTPVQRLRARKRKMIRPKSQAPICRYRFSGHTKNHRPRFQVDLPHMRQSLGLGLLRPPKSFTSQPRLALDAFRPKEFGVPHFRKAAPSQRAQQQS